MQHAESQLLTSSGTNDSDLGLATPGTCHEDACGSGVAPFLRMQIFCKVFGQSMARCKGFSISAGNHGNLRGNVRRQCSVPCLKPSPVYPRYLKPTHQRHATKIPMRLRALTCVPASPLLMAMHKAEQGLSENRLYPRPHSINSLSHGPFYEYASHVRADPKKVKETANGDIAQPHTAPCGTGG